MTSNTANEFVIQQVSVFSENKPGRLSAIAKALREENVNISAFTIAESKGFGVVRIIVDKPTAALNKLANLDFMVSFTNVIAIRMPDETGGLYETAKILGDAEINIEYAYAYSGKKSAILIIRVDKEDEAVNELKKFGKVLIKSNECL